MKPYPLSDNLKALGGIFRKNGFSLYVVGGAVRDFLLGESNDDVDLTTDASPKEMLSMFPRSIPTGIQHGTLTIPFRKCHYECTTFRIDGTYEDSRHPDSVDFTKDVHEDLKRRDFTINAMCADCVTGEIVDDFDGCGDLERKVVRTVGDPEERFGEDALRIMRAIRFASRLDFSIESETFEAIRKSAKTIKGISVERINAELTKMLECDHADRALCLLRDSGLLGFIIPEVAESCESETQFKAFARRFSDNSISDSRLEIRLALLLHLQEPSRVESVLRGLKYSNNEIRMAVSLVENQLGAARRTVPELKRIIRKVGKRNTDVFLDFNRILSSDSEMFRSHESAIRSFLSAAEPIVLSDLCIGGADVMGLGLEGKAVGSALETALEIAYSEPAVNSDKQVFLNRLETELKRNRIL